MKKSYLFVGLFCLVLSAAGCGKGPAEEALKQMDQAVASAKEAGEAYAADQYKALEEAAAATRKKFEEGEYGAVLEGVKDVQAKAEEVSKAAAAKKEELTQQWDELKNGLPGDVEQAEKRIAELSAMRRLPKDIDKDAVEAAKTGLDEVKQLWGEAQSAFESGGLKDALEKAQAVKAKLVEIFGKIGLTKTSAG